MQTSHAQECCNEQDRNAHTDHCPEGRAGPPEHMHHGALEDASLIDPLRDQVEEHHSEQSRVSVSTGCLCIWGDGRESEWKVSGQLK